MLLYYVYAIFILLTLANSLQLENRVVQVADFVPRVVNGHAATLGDVPYQIALKRRGRGGAYRTFCGATLITERKLISAAHCFEEVGSKCASGKVSLSALSSIQAVAGNLYNSGYYTKDSLKNGQWRSLDNMFYPPRFKFPNHDIAVGNTKRAFRINDYVRPIPYTKRFAEYRGTCLVSGYGRVARHKTSPILLLANLQIIPTPICSRRHRRAMIHFVCTDMEMSDVGKGDSGGPLVCSGTGDPAEDPSKGILVGVVSGTRYGVGSFFTRVSSFKGFIASSAHRYSGCILLFLINASCGLFLYCFI